MSVDAPLDNIRIKEFPTINLAGGVSRLMEKLNSTPKFDLKAATPITTKSIVN